MITRPCGCATNAPLPGNRSSSLRLLAGVLGVIVTQKAAPKPTLAHHQTTGPLPDRLRSLSADTLWLALDGVGGGPFPPTTGDTTRPRPGKNFLRICQF